MRRMGASAAVTVAAVLAVVAASPAAATTTDSPNDVTVVASGLDGPRQISFIHGLTFVVAESDSGEITEVDARRGAERTLVSGLDSPQGVDGNREQLFVALGGPPPGAPGGGAPGVLETGGGGEMPKLIADTLQFELDFNPDGQTQFVPGVPFVDTLSNPFSVLAGSRGVLLADAGVNAVLKINRRAGTTRTFFVPPVITTGACAGLPNNPGTIGCDPVPTGITEDHHGSIYVSTLGSEVPGAARVYKLSWSGKVLKVYDGLTSATGVAVGDDGSVYVSNVIEGAPEGDGPPPPGFDPSTIGEITRIAPDGTRTYAQVTMPTGLAFRRGKLYASAWSIASFLGIPSAGQVVTVSPHAFH